MLRHALASCLLAVLACRRRRGRRSRLRPAIPPHQRTGTARSRLDNSNLPECAPPKASRLEDNAAVYEGNVECKLPDGGYVCGDVIKCLQEQRRRPHRRRRQRRVFRRRTDTSRRSGCDTTRRRAPACSRSRTGFSRSAQTSIARQFAGQTPEVDFLGARLEKIGPRRFRVTNGKWTTCIQPTPRWDFTASSMVLELDHHVTARNTVLRVKGVPLLWLPCIYYPIQEDESLHRISDADLRHVDLPRSDDQQRVLLGDRSQPGRHLPLRLVQPCRPGCRHRVPIRGESAVIRAPCASIALASAQTTFTENGTTSTLAASTSYELNASAVQMVAPGIVARARVDYFSDIVSQQLLHQTLYERPAAIVCSKAG